jgi:hypothetical protein
MQPPVVRVVEILVRQPVEVFVRVVVVVMGPVVLCPPVAGAGAADRPRRQFNFYLFLLLLGISFFRRQSRRVALYFSKSSG